MGPTGKGVAGVNADPGDISGIDRTQMNGAERFSDDLRMAPSSVQRFRATR